MPQTSADSAKSKSVIIKYAFTLADLKNDPDYEKEMKDDMKEMAETYGTVKTYVYFRGVSYASIWTMAPFHLDSCFSPYKAFSRFGQNSRRFFPTSRESLERSALKYPLSLHPRNAPPAVAFTPITGRASPTFAVSRVDTGTTPIITRR